MFEDKLREARRLLVEARESTGCSWCRRRVDELVGAVEALERIGVKAEEVAREYMSSPLSRVGEIRAEAEEVASRGGW
ncbi:MAG: hypothetical protein QXQ95_08680 [Thermofilum sp.]|uniref:hypothetical protein n=1 Tax=Thermofilum sp. TaxID=1961369 RepID=UPI00316EDB92